jgi:hypothetical protein
MGGYLAIILAAPSVVRREITQKVERTKLLLSEMNPLLLRLRRERHPTGYEQVMLDFALRERFAQSAKCVHQDDAAS